MRTLTGALFGLVLSTAGCGTNGEAPTTDSGTKDVSAFDVGGDAPRVWCAQCCGPVESGVDAGTYVSLCLPGLICGQRYTNAAWLCCTPDAAPDAEYDPACYP